MYTDISIGFGRKESVPQEAEKEIDPLEKILQAAFSPTGEPQQKDFRTTEEIEYMLRETVDVSFSDINKMMNKLGYQTKFLEGCPVWIVFLNNQD